MVDFLTTGYYKSAKLNEYDAADRIVSEWTHYSFEGNPTSGITCWTCDAYRVSYAYDANNNRKNVIYHDISNFAITYSYDALNRMTGVAFPGGSATYAYDTLGRRTSVAFGNGTKTEYAYEDDSDLDWMRHVFQGGASATAANDNWVGIYYGYDFFSGRALLPKSLWPFWRALVSHRLNSTSATDVVSRKRAAKVGTGFASASAPLNMGAMPTQGTYGAANAINQVANVPGRAPMTWTDSGNMQTDGKGATFVHDGNNRLIKATKANGDVYHFRYDGDGLRMETIKNPTGMSANFQHTGGTVSGT